MDSTTYNQAIHAIDKQYVADWHAEDARHLAALLALRTARNAAVKALGPDPRALPDVGGAGDTVEPK